MGAKQGKVASPVQQRVPKIHENEQWVKFIARTTSKQNRVSIHMRSILAFRQLPQVLQEVTTDEFIRRILPGTPLKLGSSALGDVCVSEASLDAVHVHVSLTNQGLTVVPVGRTYHLLGQTGTASSSHVLTASTTIKMGACSLGVGAAVKHTDQTSTFESTYVTTCCTMGYMLASHFLLTERLSKTEQLATFVLMTARVQLGL